MAVPLLLEVVRVYRRPHEDNVKFHEDGIKKWKFVLALWPEEGDKGDGYSLLIVV